MAPTMGSSGRAGDPLSVRLIGTHIYLSACCLCSRMYLQAPADCVPSLPYGSTSQYHLVEQRDGLGPQGCWTLAALAAPGRVHGAIAGVAVAAQCSCPWSRLHRATYVSTNACMYIHRLAGPGNLKVMVNFFAQLRT